MILRNKKHQLGSKGKKLPKINRVWIINQSRTKKLPKKQQKREKRKMLITKALCLIMLMMALDLKSNRKS